MHTTLCPTSLLVDILQQSSIQNIVSYTSKWRMLHGLQREHIIFYYPNNE